MGRILEELKQIEEVEVRRLGTALAHLGVIESVEQAAVRIAQIGDRERPKTEAFFRNLQEAANATGPSPTPPVPPILGPDGRAIPTRPGFFPDPKAPPGPPRPTMGTGGGGGTGLTPPERRLTSVQDRPGGGKFVEPESWLREHCERTTFRIPRPGNPMAREENDFIVIGGYDCSKELHAEVYFYDPIEPLLSSSAGGGGASTRGAPPPRAGNFTRNPDPNSGHSWIASPGGSTIVAPPQAPTPGDKLVAETVRAGLREVVSELRASGDLGLAIRRNGGL